MVFDKTIVRELGLDSEEIWVEQSILPDGIGLRLKRSSKT